MEDKKKRGRPRIGDGVSRHFSTRLPAEEASELEMFCFEHGESRSDVIRKAIDLYIKTKKYY